MVYRLTILFMGLFNKKKKEIEDDFNYEKMMKAAKLAYSNNNLNSIKSIDTNKYKDEKSYYVILKSLLKSNQFSYVHKIQTSSSDITEKYEKTTDETNYIGVYNANNTLLLAFELDLDKRILYKYLKCNTNISKEGSILYERIDMQPIKNVELNEDLLSNYSIEDILNWITRINSFPFSDEITSDYVYTAIIMYLNPTKELKTGGTQFIATD